eukprot:1159000-Pelagomonas_calceolata.AAC.2
MTRTAGQHVRGPGVLLCPYHGLPCFQSRKKTRTAGQHSPTTLIKRESSRKLSGANDGKTCWEQCQGNSHDNSHANSHAAQSVKATAKAKK